MKGERTSKQQNYFYFITKPNYFITIFLPLWIKIPLVGWPNTSRPSLGSQIKDFGTKTHFFSKKKWEKVRFRAILRKLLCLFHISQIRKALNIGGVASEAYIWCCQWHPFKYSKQRSHTRQSLSRMTHRRKRIFSSLKKRKKVDRVITTQPTLTTNIFFRLIFVW